MRVHLGVALAILLAAPPLVAAEDCKTKYKRSDYPHWGSGVRERALERATITVVVDGEPAAYMLDEYTGRLLRVGHDAIDLDHIVPTKFAHENGANCWTREARRTFANDPINLIPVSAGANRRKGAKLFSYIPGKRASCKKYGEQVAEVLKKYNFDKPPVEFKKALSECYKFAKGRLLPK